MDLQNKVAVVLGASSGIGEGISRALAEQKPLGLVLAARRKENLDTLAETLRQTYGVDTLVVPTDVTSKQQLQSLVEKTLSRYKRLDIFINSAGLIQQETPIEKQEVEKMDAIIDTNLKPTLHVAHYLVPHFQQQKSGVLITISSMAGKNAYSGEVAYCASKGGLDQGIRALDEEFKLHRQHGSSLYVFALGPGFIDTPEARKNFPHVEEDVWKKAWTTDAFGKKVVSYALDPAKAYAKEGAVVHIETISV